MTTVSAVVPVCADIISVLGDLPETALVRILKCIKNISMHPDTLDRIQGAGFIPRLVMYISEVPGERPRSPEIRNQSLIALYNLCRINKLRQEIAASNGLIPALKKIILSNSPLNQFALPMICDLAHGSKKCLPELWKEDCATFYVNLLQYTYWQTNALESVSAWMSADVSEAVRLEGILRQPKSMEKIVRAFSSADVRTFTEMSSPLLKILYTVNGLKTVSGADTFVAILSQSPLPELAVRMLQQPRDDPLVRLRLLDLLQLVYMGCRSPKKFIIQHSLLSLVTTIMDTDKKVMVHERARAFLAALEANEVL